jgi:SHS family lactate transporter-like MFS transporter
MLDAFDFFIMVFVLSDIAKAFGTGITSVTIAITLTLALRPIGALLFGWAADRFGRRLVLMVNVLTFSVFEFASGFTPSLAVFILVRGLFGVAMGGEWGVGASLTMESIPQHWRGTVSGLLQAGYPAGYLLASLLYWVAVPALDWRSLFMVAAIPGVLVFLYLLFFVPESPDWLQRQERQHRGIGVAVRAHLPLLIYAVLIMTAINFYSHGTQDLYPNVFLHVQHGLPSSTVAAIAVFYTIGAICGCVSIATLSQRFGRRRAIVVASLLSLPVVPFWAYASDPVMLGLGAFLMQFLVQGVFGVVPAHLNELSPAEIRGTFPGFVYQFGNLLASANATIQSTIADHMNHDYRFAMAIVPAIGAVVVAVLIGLGREARDIRMGGDGTIASGERPRGRPAGAPAGE